MTLQELMDTITKSSKADWHRMGFDANCPVPPQYGGHDHLAVYRPDASIILAYGWTREKEVRPVSGWWKKVSPVDARTSTHWADVWLSGTLVFRTSYVDVNDGEAFLPIPLVVHPDPTVPEQYRLFVWLLHLLAGREPHTFSTYWEAAGFSSETETDWLD